MVGLIVAGHANIAPGLMSAAALLFGTNDSIEVLALHPGVAPVTFEQEAANALKKVDSGDGVLALVDIFGGTPGNSICKMANKYGISTKIVAGANLPMLITLLSEYCEDATLDELAEKLISSGKENIKTYA